ncbi:tRNA (adenosine(37)-N6)-threonylcarbamoyltransferase complex transferase subunit TsaD [Haploplasma modicum]|uniref:tRNA (adenosine(37)-N6)-threonylcarbamoyltransferase complex transferase subunit TsaD n=1 Tax=Haploplasma modicum TaxID=2150 RepID=UPI00214AF70C|nr:tRNA (adenosine(37)-N6)-threonylcarbamoyltransferase complex transferase subunit TsaD [Haploplasma modicum]MCR1809329.1 tRNA (adenosine(37)-N6)-threonylcarbamoyltransferase complex transferase subunit TsaD [Haploplasma modicum]
MIVLAIESSCDETSVAILKDQKEVLSHIVFSQIDIHTIYGGVVPEIASRNHVKHVTRLIEEAISKANINVSEIDLVAVTQGPGLIGSLLVGINAATAFAYANNIKIIGVNHLIGHIYAAGIENEMKFPLMALLVSGGHTELIYMKKDFDFEIIGTTLDDAVGEAYDKVARTLGLSYPGGPVIDKLAKLGKDTYDLPRVLLDKDEFNFSFSGLKSAVINKVHNLNQKGLEVNVNDMATSFQNSVMDVLLEKSLNAIKKYDVKQFILAGGVAANSELRRRVNEEIKGIEVLIPSFKYCTDNAAMIASAAFVQESINGVNENYIIKGFSTKQNI